MYATETTQRRGHKRELFSKLSQDRIRGDEERVESCDGVNAIPSVRTLERRQQRRAMGLRSTSWMILAVFCLMAFIPTVASNDDAYNNYNGDDQYSNDAYQVTNNNNNNGNGNGNYNQYYNKNANNNNNNQYYANNNNYNYNKNNDDDANNDDKSDDKANDQYDYEEPAFDDQQIKAWEDDYISLDLDNGFDGVNISPVSCVNYNNGHMIKFEMYKTENSYQCHFNQIGTFVVSISHYMRAYFNYQALTRGNSFKLPDDVGYLNCIPLKMEAYGYGDNDDDSGNDDDGNVDDAQNDDGENDDENQQPILYAKIGCSATETYTSNTFQLHVYTDDKCTEVYDDGQTDQYHASKGYLIDLDQYYDTKLDDENDDGVRFTNDSTRTLRFSTSVTFRPRFYSCQSCKPKISGTFNRYAGNFYDDNFIAQYGMTRSAYKEYLAEQEAAKCNNCQYFHYSTDDSVDDYNNSGDDGTTDDGSSASSSSSSGSDDSVQTVDDAYYNVGDDWDNSYMANSNYYWGNRKHRQRRLGEERMALVPVQSDLKKFESEFWDHFDAQLDGRALYENQYGGVDDWNMCNQVYRYGLYCDEQCQSLDAFRKDQWSDADLILLGIMGAFMAAMVLLVMAKRRKATRVAERQKSFFTANQFDTKSGISASQIPGLPTKAMCIMLFAIFAIIAVLALLNFVNETLVFAVVCCILLFIYMLKITLFSVRKRPLLLASPNHDDLFGYDATDDNGCARGFFS